MSGFSRRDFIRSTAATAAASSLAQAAQEQPAGTPAAKQRDIKMSLKIGMIQEGDTLLEKFRIAKAAGFDGVELDSPGIPPVQDVRDACSDTGLIVPGVVGSFHWHDQLAHPDAAARERGEAALATAIRDCRAVGGSTVLLVPAVVGPTVDYDDAWTRSTAAIERALPLAQELGVAIALENVWNNFLLSPMEASRYVDQFKSPHVGWYFDVGNIVAYGWPPQWVKILGPRILKLDVKEYSRAKLDQEGRWAGFSVPIGEGDCQWTETMAALDDVGYAGWASAEVGGGDSTRLAEIARRMKTVLNA
ncbi:MAG: sugar phosphate isomerase/epimerase [Phycisphaerales bacterium]|nr:sugar phosphate isomerase/epimerase [Phycisphaerales bacterium]